MESHNELITSVLTFFDLEPIDPIMILVWGFLFLIIWRLFDASIFSAFLGLVESREAATSGALTEAQLNLKKAEDILGGYTQTMTEARITNAKVKSSKLEQAKLQAATIVNTAKAEAQEYLEKERDQIGQRIKVLRTETNSKVAELSGVLEQRVMKLLS